MSKQATKSEFILKLTFAMIFAIATGATVFPHAAQTEQLLIPWISGFLYTFSHFLCIVIMQWLLLSDYLPKGWITLGFIGCFVAAIISGIILQAFSFEAWFSYGYEINILDRVISGALFAFPQLFVLRGKKGYLWILANVIGWTVQYIGWELWASTLYSDYFPLFRILFAESPNIPLGLLLGLYLYTYVYRPNNLQTDEARNS